MGHITQTGGINPGLTNPFIFSKTSKITLKKIPKKMKIIILYKMPNTPHVIFIPATFWFDEPIEFVIPSIELSSTNNIHSNVEFPIESGVESDE